MFLVCDDCALNYQEIETHQKEFQTKHHSLKNISGMEQNIHSEIKIEIEI